MTKFALIFSLMVFHFISFSQELQGFEAASRVKGAVKVRYIAGNNLPNYVLFSQDEQPTEALFIDWLKTNFKLDANTNFKELNRTTDQIGQTHIRYQQTFNGIPLREAILIAHCKSNKILSFNGILFSDAKPNTNTSLSESKAVDFALNYVSAKVYKWQIHEEEVFIKEFENNPAASYYPKAELYIIHQKEIGARYAYKFNIYAQEPLSRADIYVDAADGKILFVNNRLRDIDSNGTANTKFSSVRSIKADFYNSQFRLRETARGNGIETFNLQTGSNYGAATDFIDLDNYWNNINAQKDEIATDAHWGMEKTYDYYFQKYNRNSIDGLGFKLISYVHYQVNYANAFWNGQYMTFGDGNSSMQPLVALDIVGHEISHGLTEFTANLDYQDESGAMNEGFSDIFGACIEKFGKGGNGTWTMGEDIGQIMRSMSNPPQYGDPDTYLGTNYYLGTADNGGVHTNSGVLNYWFYLLTTGGIGTNDLGNPFNVTGLGIDTAGAIAYRTLTFYLTNTSQYADARYYAIQAATDLYGPCSQAVISTTNAFYAIGVGGTYVPGVQANFNATLKNYCAPPAVVQFTNQSNNANAFTWHFGDGTTSTAMNPSHTYTNFGSYVVKLVSSGGTCGIDSVIKQEYIKVDSSFPCQSFMPNSGSQTLTTCKGILYDSGGPNNYPDNSNSVVTINVAGASSIHLNFLSFDFEQGFDYLNIYDGPSINSPLIGSYDGTTLPNGGFIQSTTGSICLKQYSDQGLSKPGFIAEWQCVQPQSPPIVNFENDSISCTGLVAFKDKSLNGAISWLWNFGDGSTSALQNPTHTYAQNGDYSVNLIVTNTVGNSNLLKQNAVKISFPDLPIVSSKSACTATALTLSASVLSGNIVWYDQALGGTPLDTGFSFTTPILSQSTVYYAQNSLSQPIITGGKANNTGGGGYLTSSQGLIFDVHKTMILNQVKVYADAAGSRTLQLLNSNGNTIATKTFTVSVGGNYVVLNFAIPAGNNYQLKGSNLWRNNASVSYPYNLGNLATIKTSTAGTTPLDFYYFFYDWKVQEPSCESARVPVYASINTMAPIADFSSISNDPTFAFTDLSTNKGANSWEFGDGNTSTFDNPSHTYITNGTYNVKLTVDNGCGIHSTLKTLVVSLATGIKESEKSEVKIYPIPAHEKIWIEMGENSDFSNIKLFDINGRNLIEATISTTEKRIELNTSELSQGVYFIQLYGNSKIHSFKIIVQ